ncbi:MAG TPA: hypothetical protein PLT47_10330 [Bacteroidales bacterium]|nr:hypothetical protein [Bacteroidales bacterium]HQI71137.1 hypothetical protein [Bacteroidales bacterium]
MKYLSLTLILIAILIIVVCSNSLSNSNPNSNTFTTQDSCEIALKFENAKAAESLVDKNYSGELNNYWGNDKSKLDFKHVFKDGSLVKSYFYYENQNVQEEYSFRCGALHGQQKWYYDNGRLAKIIPYSYGYRTGTGLLYDNDGNIMQKVTFRNDSIVGKIQTFDRSGRLISNDTIEKQ